MIFFFPFHVFQLCALCYYNIYWTRNDVLLSSDNALGESFRCSGLLLLELRMPCRHRRLNHFVWVKVQRIRLQAQAQDTKGEIWMN